MKKARKLSSLEKQFAMVWRLFAPTDLPEPTWEYPFVKRAGPEAGKRWTSPTGKPRAWRFDLCWPEQMVAAELEGGVFVQGRHTQGAAMTADCRKYNAAVLLGWRLLRYTTLDLRKRPLQVIEEIAELLRDGMRAEGDQQKRLFDGMTG